MITKITGGTVVTDGTVSERNVYFAEGKILDVTEEALPSDAVIDAGGLYVCPGFIDLHTHGAAGFDFGSAEPEGILRAAAYHRAHGTTAMLPTVTSSTFPVTYRALENLEKAAAADPSIVGVHLEGPYFSPAQAGGQDASIITDPIPAEYTALCERFGSLIRRWSYAPERDRDGTFCRCIASRGILPSAGHTDAIYPEMETARAAGCRLITHLYSCTSTVTRDHGFRRLGVIECAFLWDDMDVEIIADGCHLPPELIRLIVKGKGTGHVALITDSLRVTGTDAKTSSVGSTPCIIEDGVCKLIDRSAFAGSIATADRLVRVCTKDAGIPLEQTIRMAAETPARILGLPKGRLAPGLDADIVLLDRDLQVRRVIVGAESI